MIDFRNQIEALSPGEKVDLLDAVWESLEADLPPLTDVQRSELDRRMAEYRRNPSDVIPWGQVKAGIFKKQ
jgi:putative addiction module component (TIGR02574 family)